MTALCAGVRRLPKCLRCNDTGRALFGRSGTFGAEDNCVCVKGKQMPVLRYRSDGKLRFVDPITRESVEPPNWAKSLAKEQRVNA